MSVVNRASVLRHGVNKILRHYKVGIWLDDFPVAWTNVNRQTTQQLQADLLQAGYRDYSALLQDCEVFCQITVQPEMPHRPIVRYSDPVPKLEGVAQQLRAARHNRNAFVCTPDLISEICHHFKVPSFGHFCVNIAEIPTLKQLTDLETKVYNYSSAFIGTREVITLYDLEQHLCHRLRVESYDHLQLGPLLRTPIIVQHFSPPASLLKFPKIMYSDVVEGVKHLISNKSSKVQPHAVLQWLTREFDVNMPQELCVKIDSTDSIALLVLEIQREEELIAQAIKDKMAKQTQQELERLAATHASDVNLEALRQLNASVTAPAPPVRTTSLDPPREISSSPPTVMQPRSFLQNCGPLDPQSDLTVDTAPLHVVWTAMHRRHEDTCEKLLEACSYKPVVFSLKMLAEAFGNTSSRDGGSSKKPHSQWKQFWVKDVLAGLVLRAQAEHMYEPSTLDRLPEALTAPLTEDATKLCAGMLHLNTSEVSFGALYVHFLAHVQSCVRSYQDYRVNVCELGKYLGGFFHPILSREGVSVRSTTQQAAMITFWSTDALASYLLSSLVKLVGGEPVYPETAEILEQSPDTGASNVPGSALDMLQSPPSAEGAPGAGSPAPGSKHKGIKASKLDAGAESAPPYDSHWLLGSAPQALSKLASALQLCQHSGRSRAQAAVEEIAVGIRDKDDATWQFLRKFAALPPDALPWGDASMAPVDADGKTGAPQEELKPTGEGFKLVSAQELHAAAAQLHAGSSPQQLADLEVAIQRHFKAPTFAALGHGSSLLQCCADDPLMLQTLPLVSSTVPLSKVLMVTQQAAVALTTDDSSAVKQASVVKAAAACLCEHFRVSSVEALGHGSTGFLIAQAQQQQHTTSPRFVLSAAALASAAGAHTKSSCHYLGQGSTVEDACKCLLKAPLLSELHEWSSWQLLFEAELGSLSDFVEHKGVVVVLETPQGSLIKVPQHVSSEDYSSALSQRDAQAVVANLLGIVAAHRGVQHAPLAMLASQTKSHLAAMDTNETTQYQANTPEARGLPKAAAFVLECLARLPQALQVALGQPILLQPFAEVAESAVYAEQSLLKAAVVSSHRRVLHRLGFQLGITLWQDAWRSSISPPPPPQPTPTPAALVSAPTAAAQTAPPLNGLHPVLDQLLASVSSPLPNGDSQPHFDSSSDTLSPMQTDATAANTVPAPESAPETAPEAANSGSQGAQQCMAIVEAIRREEFGIGVELDAASSLLRHRQNERIGRALQRLSQELYSKDTHFVLELVQNADDNSYASGVLPALEFILQDTGVTVLNNEVGFTESNIRALCDVGRTTKKHTVGYIGQKGIGFKSVFKITDAPQIHSKDFHVSFDLVQHSALGYVLPTWVADANAAEIAAVSKLGTHQTVTKVVLPFKQGSQQQAGTLRHRFDDVRPTLLLFLQRLQCIIVNDVTADETSIMIRRPLGGGLVELRHGPRAEHSSRWLQVSHTFQPSVPRLDVHLDQTTVSLAFNLEGDAPTQQQVYAFLPLRSYGLCFIVQNITELTRSQELLACANPHANWRSALCVSLRLAFPAKPTCALAPFQLSPHWSYDLCQASHARPRDIMLQDLLDCHAGRVACKADFIVPSSREAVDCDSAWNELLRDQVPNLFLQALHSFKGLTPAHADQPMAWVNRWLQSIPLPREAQSFFAALPHSLAARLQQSQCIPTEGNHWVYPREALVCQDPQVRALLADSRLPAGVTLQYAHSGLSVLHSSQPLRGLLGVGEVAHGHLLDVVRQLHDSRGLAQMGQAWLAQLLLCVFDSLQHEQPGGNGAPGARATAAAKAATADLKKLLLLPLSDGSFATLENQQQQAMYFPLEMDDSEGDDGPDVVSGLTTKQRELLLQCKLELRLLDPAFLEAAGQDKKPALIRALEAVGLKHVMLSDVISNHVLPALPAADADSHISYLALIISSGLTAPEALNAALAVKIIDGIRASKQVVTNHGFKQLEKDFLHLPVSLGNKMDLVKLFPQHMWLFPSTAYLASGAGSATAWRVLFKALGFTDFIQAPSVALRLTPEQKAASHWADADLGPLNATGHHIVQDWSADEFQAVVTSLQLHCKDKDTLQSHCAHLTHCIDALWEDDFAGCALVQLGSQVTVKVEAPSTSHAHSAQRPPSSFLHALQTTAWLPSSQGGVQPPSALFYPDSQILTLLGEHVPYLACPVKDPNFLTALQVTTQVTWRDMLRMLSCWAQQASFHTSIEQMTHVHTMLGTALHCEDGAADEICNAFAQSPLIWLPDKEPPADLSNITAAATPSLRGLPNDMTPQPQSTHRRRHPRKVAFTTPGPQAQRSHMDTPAAPAYTPYTLTPGWKAPAPHRPTQGQFYAASGDALRLWDPTGVLKSIPANKVSLRILSSVYSEDAVMHFFAEGLVRKAPPQLPPMGQYKRMNSALDGSAIAHPSTSGQQQVSPQAEQPQLQVQQQQQQQQQQQPVNFSPARSPAAATAVKAKPARVALEDYIVLVSSDDEAAAEQVEPQPAHAAPTTAAMDEDEPLPAPPQQAEAASITDSEAAPATAADSTAPAQQGQAAGPVTHQTTTSADHAGQAYESALAQTDATAGSGEAAQPGAMQTAIEPPASPPPTPMLDPAPLILAEPTCQEYCQALAAIAEPLPPALYPMQLTKVLAILTRWSRMVADGSLKGQQVSQLQDMLKDVKAFPIAGRQWVSLADGLILNDEPSLARLFEDAKGVALLRVPRGSERHGGPSEYQELEPLLQALQVPYLSRAVQQSVVPVPGWSGSVELDPIIADCLLALQRYLVHHMPALYQAEQDTVAPLLLNLRCVIVGSLQVEYRLPTGSGVTISQPQPRAAALQDSDLYVEVDKLDSYTHILPELTRLFAKGAVQPELAQFLIALTLTMMSRQDVEAFMQQRGCPPLPQHILEWQTPHLAKPPPEEEDDQDLDEEAAEAKQQEARLAFGEGLLGDLALARTKRELSPSASEDLDEPNTKKQKVGGEGEGPQADHYTPMMDPSARRVDYLDLATPQSASRSLQAMHHPGQRAPSPTHLQRPQAPFFADDVLMYPPPPKRVPLNLGTAAAPWPSNVGRQIAPFKKRRHKRPGVREHDTQVYKELVAEAGGQPIVSSMQDLYDAMYPYKATPWVLQDIGHRAPSAWRAVAALAVRAPQHLPTAIRSQPRPSLDGPAPRIDPIDLNHQTGRWGEELVFSYLQWQLAAFSPRPGIVCDQMYECPSTGWQVEWINYKEETRKPFDIRLRDDLGDDIFIEVKASALRGKNIFNMSLPEMKFAEAQGNNLHIYRVAGVGTDNPSLTRLINPIQLTKMRLINLCVQM